MKQNNEMSESPWELTTDLSRMDRDVIYHFIKNESYWGKHRTREQMDDAIDHSRWVFGLYDRATNAQIGFARVISDGITFGYLTDVFILSSYQGKGLGRYLLEAVMNHEGVAQVGRMVLLTEDPDFYTSYGFSVHRPEDPMELMQRKLPGYL